MAVQYSLMDVSPQRNSGFVYVYHDVKNQLPPPTYGTRYVLKVALIILCSTIVFSMVKFTDRAMYEKTVASYSSRPNNTQPMIVIVTPTYQRPLRMADLTRMANTLRHVEGLHWILIEDGDEASPQVVALLDRVMIPHSYLPFKTIDGFPRKGWYQRNMAMKYIKENMGRILSGHQTGVLYFGDDDNCYDIRLFENYIRKVEKLGAWAVGLVGGTQVEAPRVEGGKLVDFDVRWRPDREFPIDMAGFAINLRYIKNSTGGFDPECALIGKGPETCFLERVGFKRTDIQPFVPDQKENKEIYVWHTKPQTPQYNAARMDSFETVFTQMGLLR